MIILTRSPIDIGNVMASVADHATGATVLFLGTTREFTQGRQTTHLNYECHDVLARNELERLLAVAQRQWPESRWCVVHRLGRVELGEASVAIAVSLPHRQDAFAAAHWMIDRIKETVPIWKEEFGPDGRSEWIHPPASHEIEPAGLDSSQRQTTDESVRPEEIR